MGTLLEVGVLDNPLLVVPDPRVAVRVGGAAAAPHKAGNADHLAVVDGRSAGVPVADTVVRLVEEAELHLEAPADQLVALLEGDGLEGVVLQVAGQIPAGLESAPAGNDDVGVVGGLDGGQGDGLDAAGEDQGALQPENGHVVVQVGIVSLVEDDLDHVDQDTAAEPVIGSGPDGEPIGVNGHEGSVLLLVGHTMGGGEDEVLGDDRTPAAVGAGVPQGDLVGELGLGGILAADDASVAVTGCRLYRGE